MSAVKITAADKAFALCVKERSGWKCERCGGQYQDDAHGKMALHCSHYHGRGKWGVRADPVNADSHCYGCHRYLTAHPGEHRAWKMEQVGQGMLDILQERANDTSLGRLAKRSKKEITAHYRQELARMKQLRADGVTGRIEFENWC